MSTPVSLNKEDLGKIFKRDDIRGIWPDQLNSQVVERIAASLLAVLGDARGKRIVVGHDARTGSYELTGALCKGLEACGCGVRNLGLCSTEQVYYMAGRYADDFVCGAMITASHNPKEYNGIKFVHAGGVPFSPAELKALREHLEENWESLPCDPVGDEFADFMYETSGISQAGLVPGEPLRIVVAAGHGVGVKAFQGLAKKLSAHGIIFEYLDGDPDGNFPEGVPNPLLPAYNQRLGEAVRKCGADLGIGFDGDADRAGFVDANGDVLQASQVLALVAQGKMAMGQANEKPIVMGNLCCSHLLKDLFTGDEKGTLVETPVGHGRIKQLMAHDRYRSRVIFAGEHSGHFFYPEFYRLDSGILTSIHMIMHLIRLRQQGLNLVQELEEWRKQYLWSGEINFRMENDAQVKDFLNRLKSFANDQTGRTRYEVRVDPDMGLQRVFPADDTADHEGGAPDVKVEVDEGEKGGWWVVGRPSGNEPVLRLNVEVWRQGKEKLDRLVHNFECLIQDCGGKRM